MNEFHQLIIFTFIIKVVFSFEIKHFIQCIVLPKFVIIKLIIYRVFIMVEQMN